MHVLGADDNEGPETVQFPPISVGVEVEVVASSLGIVVGMSNATFIAQYLELHVGAAASPLSKGEIWDRPRMSLESPPRAVAALIKVAHDQDALKARWREREGPSIPC